MDFTRLSLVSQHCLWFHNMSWISQHCHEFHKVVTGFTTLSLISQHVMDFTRFSLISQGCHCFHTLWWLSQGCHWFHKLSLISHHVMDFTRLSLISQGCHWFHNIVCALSLISQHCLWLHNVVIDFTRWSLVSQHCLGFQDVVMDFTMLSQTRTQVQRCRNTDIARNEQVKHVEGQKMVAEKVEPKMLNAKTLQIRPPKFNIFRDMELQFRWRKAFLFLKSILSWARSPVRRDVCRKACDIALLLTQQTIDTTVTIQYIYIV